MGWSNKTRLTSEMVSPKFLCSPAGLGQDDLIMKPSIWAGSIRASYNLGIFLIFRAFSILILKVLILTLKDSILKINTFKIKTNKMPKKLKCYYMRELDRSKLTVSLFNMYYVNVNVYELCDV